MNSRMRDSSGTPDDSGAQRRSQFAGQKALDETLDETLSESFPSSDPPSTIPDPGEADLRLHSTGMSHHDLLTGLPAHSWAAISLDGHKVVGTGTTRAGAEQDARKRGFPNVELVQVPESGESPGQSKDAA
jgi:hypothetical protein